MGNYGADKVPDMNKAQILAFDLSFQPVVGGNVEQWTYDDVVVRKLARKLDKSNCLFLLEK